MNEQIEKLRLLTFVTHRILFFFALVIIPLAILVFVADVFHTVFISLNIVGFSNSPVLIVHDLSVGNPRPIAIDLLESNPVVRSWGSTLQNFCKEMCYIFIVNHHNVCVMFLTPLPCLIPGHCLFICVIRPSFNTDCNVWKWKVQVKYISQIYFILEGWWM